MFGPEDGTGVGDDPVSSAFWIIMNIPYKLCLLIFEINLNLNQ
jgi:hypothetical protein